MCVDLFNIRTQRSNSLLPTGLMDGIPDDRRRKGPSAAAANPQEILVPAPFRHHICRQVGDIDGLWAGAALGKCLMTPAKQHLS